MEQIATITIGGETRNISDAEENWITQQVNRRRQDRVPVCAVVRIQTSGIDVGLSTPGCSNGGGGGRTPTSREADILHLWESHRLRSNDFTGGNLVAFIKQVRKFL
jgi:hypothetical protein